MSMSTNRKGCRYSYGYGKNFHSHRRKNRYKSSSSSSCFIATAAYGSPYVLEIDILRHWRDTSLNSNIFGELLVVFYYKISPPIADFIKNSKKIKSLVLLILKPIIKIIKHKYKHEFFSG